MVKMKWKNIIINEKWWNDNNNESNNGNNEMIMNDDININEKKWRRMISNEIVMKIMKVMK